MCSMKFSAITIHAEQGRVYWADSKTHSIRSCTVNGSNVEKVIEWVTVDSKCKLFFN